MNERRHRPAARLIAFYLPQYYPNRQNDRWWGPGFTEWTNVASARRLFRNHYQPRLPGELGFYDLRVAETRHSQAELARAHGIEGFCYWHYWFAGTRLLARPFQEVLASREPRFPFCLAWANESWSGIWHGAPDQVLQAQTYPGRRDHERHFQALLPAFTDDRYLTVDGKPLFLIYKPCSLPDPVRATDLWREMAVRAGLKGLHLAGVVESEVPWPAAERGLDALVHSYHSRVIEMKRRQTLSARLEELHRGNKYHSFAARFLGRGLKSANHLERMSQRLLQRPAWIFRYEEALPHFLGPWLSRPEYYPTVVPCWDNTARCGIRGLVLHQSTPQLFQRHVREALDLVARKPFQKRIVFVKSWNEWAEGNYLEPDRKHGRGYLEGLREVVMPARPRVVAQ